MNSPILNRSGGLPSDGWYQIEVPGEHFNREGGLVQLIDEEARVSIVNRFAARAAAAGEGWSGILIDRDHFSLDPDKSTEAFGWLMEVRNRAGELEGRIDWTDIGQPAVEKKRFKFFSTVYDRDSVVKVGERKIRNRTYPLVRPLELDRLALTNDPNNKGGKPISNRASGESQPTKNMKNLLKKMGLSEDASEDAALAAYGVIANRATKAEGDLAAAQTELGTLRVAVVDLDIEKYKNRIKPENLPKVRAQLIANRAGTIELLESMEEPLSVADPKKPITNRTSATTPAGGPSAAVPAPANDAETAQKILNRANELRPKCANFDAAWAQATREVSAGTVK